MALHFFGVTLHDAHATSSHVPAAEVIAVRDVAAICAETEYRAVRADAEAVQRHTDVIGAFAAKGPVLPAPVGVIFRSSDSVKRWLELHYSALTEALTFVENRVAGRVHVWRTRVIEGEQAELTAEAGESLRVLRRAAVATLPLDVSDTPELVHSAAFLVEDELWKDFLAEVDAQSKVASRLRFEVTGPFPPYDFVKMQLGA